jgi:hypothetical protein
MTTGGGRTTIALTHEANAVVDQLCDRFPFKERTDAAKFGIAYAVRTGMEPAPRGPTSGPVGSTWGVAGFDTDGKLKELVRALYDLEGQDPYVALESLMNQGLLGVGDAVALRRPQTLTDLVSIAD